MTISTTFAVATLELCLLITYSTHRWRLLGHQERMSQRVGVPVPVLPRWHRSNQVLARVPGLGKLARRADDAALVLNITDLVIIGMIAGYLLYRVMRALLGPTAALPMSILIVPTAIWMIVDALARRRRERILAQIPDLVRLLAGAAKAGLSMSGSLMHAAADVGEPTSSELERVVLSVELGKPLSDALEVFAERLGSRDLEILTSAISIQQRSGGDLVALLSRLGLGLEATRRGRREVRSITAGLSSQAYLGVILGFGGAVMANKVTSGGLERALHKPLTAALFIISATLLLISIPIIRRMVRIEA